MNNKIILLAVAALGAAVVFGYFAVTNKEHGTPEIIENNDSSATSPEASYDGRVLFYNGAPIDPLCFIPSDDFEEAAFPLTDCDDLYIKTNEGYEANDEFAGTGFRYKDSEVQNTMRPAFVRYKDLGEHEGGQAVLVEWSGGGSGYFSSLYVLERLNDRLRVVKTLASGDRCNNGIFDANRIDGKLVYNVNFTPSDVITLAGAEKSDYLRQGLAQCAACCYGVARYQDGDLNGVSFSVGTDDLTPSGEANAQRCFDTVLQAQIAQTGSNMNMEMLRSFVQTLSNDCRPYDPGEHSNELPVTIMNDELDSSEQ